MFWARLDSSTLVDGAYEFWHGNDTGPYWWMGTAVNNAWEFYVWRPSDNAEHDLVTANGTAAIGEWHHIAMVTAGSTHTCYIDGGVVGTLSLAMDSLPGSGLWESLGRESGNPEIAIAEFRRWTASLSQGEVQTEMASRLLVRSANVFRSVQLGQVDGTDVSGQGHHFETIGTNLQAVTGPRGSVSASPSASVSPSVSSSTSESPSASESASESPSASVSPS